MSEDIQVDDVSPRCACGHRKHEHHTAGYYSSGARIVGACGRWWCNCLSFVAVPAKPEARTVPK
jgi:hypothetical protein